MKTATKNYAEQTDYASLINAGGNAAGNIIHQLKWNGEEPDVVNNTTYNTTEGAGMKTSTVIIVVAVLIVAVVGVVLFTRK